MREGESIAASQRQSGFRILNSNKNHLNCCLYPKSSSLTGGLGQSLLSRAGGETAWGEVPAPDNKIWNKTKPADVVVKWYAGNSRKYSGLMIKYSV